MMNNENKKKVENVKQIIKAEEEKNTNEPKVSNDNLADFAVEKRNPKIINKLKEIIKEERIEQAVNEEEALYELSMKRVETSLVNLSNKTASVIVNELLENASEVQGNPLVEREISNSKVEFRSDIKELSLLELCDKYKFVRIFNFLEFKNEVLPLEEEHLLEYYFNSCSKLFKRPSNAEEISKYSKYMLSSELEVFLEDIARL